jgi:hypothetical protein
MEKALFTVDLSSSKIQQDDKKQKETLPRVLSTSPTINSFSKTPPESPQTPRVLPKKIPGLQQVDEDEDEKPKKRSIKPTRLLMPVDLQVVLYKEPLNSPKISDLRHVNLHELNIGIAEEFRIPLDKILSNNQPKSIKPHPQIEVLNKNSNAEQIQNQQLVVYRSPQRLQNNTSQTQLSAQLTELQPLSYNHQQSNAFALNHMTGYTLKLNMSLLGQAPQKQTYSSQTQTNKQKLLTYPSPQRLQTNTSQTQLPAQDAEFEPLSCSSLMGPNPLQSGPSFVLKHDGYTLPLTAGQYMNLLEQKSLKKETYASKAQTAEQPPQTSQTAEQTTLTASIGFIGEDGERPGTSISNARQENIAKRNGCFSSCAIS